MHSELRRARGPGYYSSRRYMTADFWRTLTRSMGRIIVIVLLLTGVVAAQDVEQGNGRRWTETLQGPGSRPAHAGIDIA